MRELPAQPVSDFYGFDRGTPVDRVYIEHFIDANAHLIRGGVLEVRDDRYCARHPERILRTSVVDIAATNPRADLIADLTLPGSLPEASYDCVILTQTLQYLGAPAAALRNCHQALRPGGSLLISCPAVGRLCVSRPGDDLWRFTPPGLDRLLRVNWAGPFTVTGYGNLRTCLATLVGEAAEELGPAETWAHDPRFPLVACAVATRPHGSGSGRPGSGACAATGTWP
jgi:SAM-dependent methyltransferase